MGRKRTWPGTPEERTDRNTVVTLIEQVGGDRLRFTVADLRKRLQSNEHLSLHHSRDLARHVAYLEGPGTLLVRVGARFDSGGTNATVARSKHTFVLTSRLPEFQAGHAAHELDDVERVRLALWVAFLVCGSPVPTNAVTLVLRNILPLAIPADRQTSLYLGALAGRVVPLVEKIRIPSERWVRWTPVGDEPAHPDMAAWVREAAPHLAGRAALASAGHATKGEVAREIVEIAVKSHRSPRWPDGRSVTMSDLLATVSADERARLLNAHLKRIGGSLGTVLGDITKVEVLGRERVDQRVVKVFNLWSQSTYYDVPGLPGFESRTLVVAMRGLASLLSAPAMHALTLEHAAATALQRSDDPAAAAIGSARFLHLQHELDLIGEPLQATKAKAHLLSGSERNRLDELAGRYLQIRAVKGTTAEALDRAVEALAPYGVTPAEVLAVSRPLLTGTEYACWFPPAALRGLEPAEFLARAKTLHRYSNPRFVSRADPDPVCAAPTAVDRVEALVYAARQRSTPMAGFLANGAALLGRFLRDPRVASLALESNDSYLRHQGLAALALLGDDRGYQAAKAALSEPSASIRPTDALYALLVLRRFEEHDAPVLDPRTADLSLLRLIQDAKSAALAGRWLLQR